MSSSVISSPSPPAASERNNSRSESPRFKCTTQGCNQNFTNANELAIHKQKHQMTLKLGPSRTGLADMLPFDQTPTPTKFLQFGKETGLFDEISNPFDSEFKRNTSGQSLKERAKRSAVPGLIINNQLNKARTPTSYPMNQVGLAPVAQPVHVITLTPTLPSPVGAIAGGPFFLPPLPSPQAFLPSPAALISPSIVPFSAPGLPFHSMQAVAQQAAITQAFINAVASSGQSELQQTEDSNASSHGHMTASRTSSINDLPNSATAPFPTQNVSVPVQSNPTPPSCHAMPVGQNMASAPVGSASVIQQHGQVNVDHQRRALSQSNSLDLQTHQMPNMERKPSFHGETSVITQAPANSSTSSQMNPNMNIHNATSAYQQQYMGSQNNIAYHQPACEMSRVPSHPVLTSSRSVPIPAAHNGQHTLPHQNSLPNIDAKQKLKETLTNNNPHLQVDMPIQFSIKEEDKNQNEVSSSSGHDGKTGRRRGRQSEIDPDRKRMRFLERNRAAASRCRAKKKQWVSGLEVKAKELSTSNVGLQNEVASLREEVASLKQLLLAHRDCPITRVQQQKLANAGGDPSAVVTNPVQAAASLLGLTQNENGETHNDSKLVPPPEDDIKPALHLSLTHTNSNSSLTDDSQGHNMQMQTSVLVTPNIACKSEQISDWCQSTNASTIVMNDNYASSSSSLSSASST